MAARPFTRQSALAAGITDRELAGPRCLRLFQGVYIESEADVGTASRCRGALLRYPPGARISHHSAAELYGIPVPATPTLHVSVDRPQDRRVTAGVRCHARPGRSVRRQGLPVSTPIQLLLELAGSLEPVDLVVAGDALLACEHMTQEALCALVEARSGPGVRPAARAARLMRAGVDSPMETRLRLLLVFAGLPEPVVDHRIHTREGEVLVRLDLSYPQHRIAVEYDGRHHAENPHQWRRDIARREWLDRRGWRIVVVTAEGIYREPERTLRRVSAALGDRGAPAAPLKDTWRQHFSAGARE